MTTAIVSDLHLGTVTGTDVARGGAGLERLAEIAAAADRLVVLGDLLELRERPVAAVLDDVAPALERIGAAAAGKPVVLVPGNHDHQLIAPALERARLAGAAPSVTELPAAEAGGLAARVAAALGDAEPTLSYPGLWLRDDLYATHGHYLDAHLTVPRVECLLAAAIERFGTRIDRAGPTDAADYEAILGPIYALSHALAQNMSARPALRRNNLSRRVWTLANDGRGRTAQLRRAAIARAAIPAAVAAINATGMGPFRADLSGPELRDAGLRAIAEVVARLRIDARHVVFGHTHRAGPLPGEDEGWLLAGGGRLTNSGSWVDERTFTAGDGPANPYWPGRVVWVEPDGPPRLEVALDGADRAADLSR